MPSPTLGGRRSDPLAHLFAATPFATGLASRETPIALFADLAAETIRFSSRRVRAYAKLLETMARCREPTDVLDAQASFAETTVRDYMREADELRRVVAKSLPTGAGEDAH